MKEAFMKFNYMTTAIGCLPINSTGMRKLSDALDEANSKLKEYDEKEQNKEERIAQQFKWISVKERMPEPLQNVIVCTDINSVTLAWINGTEWCFADQGNGKIERYGFEAVTHWMPLPEPPIKVDDYLPINGRSVEDKLPDDKVWVNVFGTWMPLPEKPKEVQDNA